MGVVLVLGYKYFELMRDVYIVSHLVDNFEQVFSAEAYPNFWGYLLAWC